MDEVGEMDMINVLNKRYGNELINIYFESKDKYYVDESATKDYLMIKKKGLVLIFKKSQSIKENDYSKLISKLANGIQGEITWSEDFHFQGNTNWDYYRGKAIIFKNWTIIDDDDFDFQNYRDIADLKDYKIQSVFDGSPILESTKMGSRQVGAAKDERVYLLEKYDNSWYKVRSKNIVGYMWVGWFK